jgi:protein-S-isoprenylcysteine O-methyltransferase Ste14
VLAGAHVDRSLVVMGLALLVLLGAIARMLAEEHLVVGRYPEYAAYAARTKRMLPYIF